MATNDRIHESKEPGLYLQHSVITEEGFAFGKPNSADLEVGEISVTLRIDLSGLHGNEPADMQLIQLQHQLFRMIISAHRHLRSLQDEEL